MALSDTRIRALKPKPERYEVADAGGLFLEVQPSGAKIWRYRYRLNGKREKVTIGLTPRSRLPDQVKVPGRDSRRRALARITLSFNRWLRPGNPRRATCKSTRRARGDEEAIVEAFATKRFIPEVLSQQRRADTCRRRLNRHLLPTLGNRQLEEVEAGDLLAILDRLRQRDGAGGTPRADSGSIVLCPCNVSPAYQAESGIRYPVEDDRPGRIPRPCFRAGLKSGSCSQR